MFRLRSLDRQSVLLKQWYLAAYGKTGSRSQHSWKKATMMMLNRLKKMMKHGLFNLSSIKFIKLILRIFKKMFTVKYKTIDNSPF